MKTILYNPIFINPQAYYVFPRLTRYLQPDNESTAEPANYIGTIEVKVIAYGDTTLKRTYTNTDSIDLSEFKNTWVRISLFTKVGSCVLGEWKIGNMESDLPYIDPEVLASLKAVVIVGNKTNNDSDRAIVKNLVDPDNPFVISNAAFKLNSGFGKYEVDFTSWIQTNGVIASSDKVQNSITGRFLYFNTVNKKEDVPSFKVNITLGQQSKLQYNYIKEDGTSTYIVYSESGIYTIPASYFSKYTGGNAWFGFYQIEGTSIIEQIPSFEGAFVTDGIDDLITSTKTVQEMLGGSNEITVVSMAHFIKGESNAPEICRINQIRRDTRSIRNSISKIGKSGIFGYTYKNGVTTINNILGDKKDCTAEGNLDGIVAPFSVEGYYYNNNSNPLELCSIAWYWTIIANKVLTTDQINQVIAYFNLDRTLKPDILCDVKKQGITNENHAEFGDKLIDFSGNGRDIQLNNLAWDGDSGIGKYNYPNWKVNVTQGNKYARIVYYDSINGTYSANFKGITDLYKSYGLSIEIRVNRANTVDFHSIKEDGIYTITPPDDTTSMDIRFGGKNVYNASCNITITQIPSHAGALCLDGVNDFGKVTGMPIYKDYTVVADREIIDGLVENADGGVALKGSRYLTGAFCFDYKDAAFSFGTPKMIPLDTKRFISYQSKYVSNGISINIGTATDNDELWIGRLGNDERYSKIAIRFLMSFPYSMSEFLIERQLKKYKLGTLYPNMVEFRPIIKANDNYKIFYTAMLPLTGDIWERINIGDYVPVGRRIAIQMSFDNEAKKLVSAVSSQLGNITIVKNSNNIGYTIFGDVLKDKSPQKIGITIEQDENYVLFNPVINSNYDNYKLTFHLREYEKLINIGDYIPKGTYIRANLYLKNNIDELVTFTFNGVNIDYVKSSVSDLAYNIRQIYNYDSPQEVNITIDEYIRYEDIVQPYPVLLRFNDENGNEVSWGGKFRVGSTITRIGSAADSNLLPNIYNIFGLLLNDNQVTSSKVIVEKTMVFKAKSAYIFDNNEPKCILSPSRLRIPNSSYKLLGYIPDISGHGNHGVIHNSAYEGASGANGYLQNFSEWTKASGVSSTDSVISSSNNLVAANGWIAYVTSGTVIPTFKVEISGIPVNGNLRFEGSDQTLVNGVNIIQGITTTKVTGFYISSGYDNDWSNLKIEQIGEYEGAYCFDGVDDFVTIPTLSSGGKQVLMKVNSRKSDCYLYDQRNNWTQYLGIVSTKDFIAYNYSNQRGKTYIDGILNENITANDLIGITHNITVTNNRNDVKQYSPCIGTSFARNSYAQMALYDFMLFDNISTDDKIKELNEYVGIEGNTE